MADFDSSSPIRTETDGDVVSKIADATIPSQQLKVNADGSIDTNASLPAGTAVEITDGTDTLAVNGDGSINVVVSGEADGVEVVDYQTSASVAKDASVTHDYTVTAAKTLIGEELWASASGRLKVEVQLETAAASGVYDTIFVGFSSSASPNVRIPLERMFKQVAGAIVRIKITNIDKAAMDVY